ncbi:hypothetical protein PUN28_006267 [Cardiocondyla obscurior]|uniref:Uncharacterized protein n=1 Tax=Cardiocondyla obscurior TaxID=286306 RepID=A0AAW2G9G6_9HYME
MALFGSGQQIPSKAVNFSQDNSESSENHKKLQNLSTYNNGSAENLSQKATLDIPILAVERHVSIYQSDHFFSYVIIK